MQQRVLGRTGIWVSKFALGTMHLGAWGNADHDDAARLIGAALDAGINLIDTADMLNGSTRRRDRQGSPACVLSA